MCKSNLDNTENNEALHTGRQKTPTFAFSFDTIF